MANPNPRRAAIECVCKKVASESEKDVFRLPPNNLFLLGTTPLRFVGFSNGSGGGARPNLKVALFQIKPGEAKKKRRKWVTTCSCGVLLETTPEHWVKVTLLRPLSASISDGLATILRRTRKTDEYRPGFC